MGNFVPDGKATFWFFRVGRIFEGEIQIN